MPDAGRTIPLMIVAESSKERGWIHTLDFASTPVRPMILTTDVRAADSGDSKVKHRLIPLERSVSGLEVPSFVGILSVLEEERPAACLLLGSSTLGTLIRNAADMLNVSVFSFVTTEEDLANAPFREKDRPDLFFIARFELFAAALDDPRYGRTMFPLGQREGAALSDAVSWNSGSDLDENRVDGSRLLGIIVEWFDHRLNESVPELSIIVPAYRESKNIYLVTTRLLEMLDSSLLNGEILLVDDASPDDTYSAALSQMWRSRRIRALTKAPPRGMGNAIRHGIAHARAPILAVTMGDGSDEVSRMPEMFRMIRDEGLGLVIGSRYRRRENYEEVPLLYRFWSRCFRFSTWLLIGLHLKDYTNAYRMFHRRIFDRYGAESGGFEISPEITFKAWFATRRVAEADVRHLKRASGQSNFSFLRAGPGYGKILIKAFVNRLTGRWFTLDW